MKRYMLFAGDEYYPHGGASDLKGAFETKEEAIKAHNPTEYDYDGGWAHILDLTNLEIIKYFYKGNWANEPCW